MPFPILLLIAALAAAGAVIAARALRTPRVIRRFAARPASVEQLIESLAAWADSPHRVIPVQALNPLGRDEVALIARGRSLLLSGRGRSGLSDELGVFLHQTLARRHRLAVTWGRVTGCAWLVGVASLLIAAATALMSSPALPLTPFEALAVFSLIATGFLAIAFGRSPFSRVRTDAAARALLGSIIVEGVLALFDGADGPTMRQRLAPLVPHAARPDNAAPPRSLAA